MFLPLFSMFLLPMSLLTVLVLYGVTAFTPPTALIPRRHYDGVLSMSAVTPEAFSSEHHQDTFEKNQSQHRQERTLYDILRASPNATRDELKRKYVALARETHPDATIGRNDNPVITDDFTEIAAAWRVLGDAQLRKKYDRELGAQLFSGQVEKMAEEIGKSVAPAALHVMEHWVLPGMERGLTTTMVFAEDLLHSSDFTHAVEAALKAGQQQVHDSASSLKEQSKEMWRSAMNTTESAMRLKAELSHLIDKRLQLSLATENSALSPREALQILDGLNTVDTVSLLNRTTRRKHTLRFEISCLEKAETQYQEKIHAQEASLQQLQRQKRALEQSQSRAKLALQKQEEARRALKEAQKEAMASKTLLLENSKQYKAVQAQHKKSQTEVQGSKSYFEKKREQVRKDLLRKQDSLKDVAVPPTVSGGLTELEELRQQEQRLMEESARLDEMASQLFVQAQQVYDRAIEMEEKRHNNNNNNGKRKPHNGQQKP